MRNENINIRLITGMYLFIVAGQSPGPYLAFPHVRVDPANVGLEFLISDPSSFLFLAPRKAYVQLSWDRFLFFHLAN